MTRKIKRAAVAALSLLFLLSSFLSACSLFSDTDADDPVSVIKSAYGNTQFTISFSTDTLYEPLDDIVYTAYNMPDLPTPEWVGYIFEGWYLDENYSTPYTDGILYVYMCDVTLYAKWSEESFSTNGTYDIEFETYILEETVVKGELTDTYGGYADFGDAIAADETYIEKSSGGLRLKLQYDCGTTVPYGYDDVYEVSIAQSYMYYTVSISETINSSADSVKTIFIDIDNFDLSDTLYIDVSWTNWSADGISNDYRSYTTTTYTIAFNITRLIGFSSVYADSSAGLDDGYYQIQTHYVQESGSGSSMMESYNSVYSYLIVEDGNYTLVKPFSPYAGFISADDGVYSFSLDDYYQREMTFSPVLLYFSIGCTQFSYTSAEYYPEAYDAAYYGSYTVEYHADTGRFYGIYDLGTDLDKSIMLTGTVSGAMEEIGAAGSVNIIMTLDTDRIIRLSEIDYTALDSSLYENSYTYSYDFVYYAGGLDDLNERNLTYTAVEDYGIYTSVINYFYSVAADGGKTMHDSRITVCASSSTAGTAVANSRYKLAYFTMTAEIYGYDVTADGQLYADCVHIGAFDGGLGIRQWVQVKQGISCTRGDQIVIADLYSQFVGGSYTTSSSAVSYTIYDIRDGQADFTAAAEDQSSVFYFSGDIAVLFTISDADGTRCSLVYLTDEGQPSIVVNDTDTDSFTRGDSYTYYSGAVHVIGDSVTIPDVSYTWGDISYSFTGNWYNHTTTDDEGNTVDVNGIDPTRVACYAVEDGAYTLIYLSRDTMTFTISAETVCLVYQVENAYGENVLVYIWFYSTPAATYVVSSDNIADYSASAISADEVSFDKDTNMRNGINTVLSYYTTYDEIGGYLSVNYTITLNNYTGATTGRDASGIYEYTLSSATVYFSTGSYAIYPSSYSTYSEFTSAVMELVDTYIMFSQRGLCEDYFYIRLYYYCKTDASSEQDTITVRLLYNVTVNGKTTSDLLSYDSYFTGNEYTFYVPALYTTSGAELASGTVSIRAYSGSTLTSVTASSGRYTLVKTGLSYSLTFNREGVYRLAYTINLYRDANGDKIFSSLTSAVSFTFYQYITVYDGSGYVYVTYVTDAAHPFSDIVPSAAIYDEATGDVTGYSYTAAYSLTGTITTLTKYGSFSSSITDSLFGWVTDTKFDATTASYVYDDGLLITDFVEEFNAQSVTLYAVWDEGITVTAVNSMTGAETSVSYYLTDSGTHRGSYTVSIGDFYTPGEVKGFTFSGWTGSITGGKTVKSGSYYITASTAATSGAEYFIITSDYTRLFRLTFVIDGTYSQTSVKKAITNISDGDMLNDTQYADAMNVRSGTDAESGIVYTFSGWSYKDEGGNYITIDLSTVAITGALVDACGENSWYTQNSYNDTLVLYAVFAGSDGVYYYS